MRHINVSRTALSVGAVVGFSHVVWALFVALGWAKPLLDFVLRLHFIQLDVPIAPFAAGTAAALVAVTFAVGAGFGLVFALVWNRLAGKPI